MEVSVIIPTLNEERYLADTIERVRDGSPDEILVVDGGSEDRTRRIAVRSGARVLRSEAGRGTQLKHGAESAQGEIYLFLHGDTLLPDGYKEQVKRILSAPPVAAGSFQLRIEHPSPWCRLIEKMANFRARVCQIPYGDQTLFMTEETYRQAGGFPDVPLLEDVSLVRRIQKLGRIRLASAAIRTSGRRWEEHGVLGNTARNQFIMLSHVLGVSPDRLSRWYYDENGNPEKT